MSNSPERATTLAFAPGAYPFALTDDDTAKTLSGDQWAWRFLRLSPAYRHDYALWVARPAWLDPSAGMPLASLKTSLSDADWQTLLAADSRYFTLDGKPLGRAVEWPNLQSETLQQALSANTNRGARVVVRELDAPRLYGVGHWFDPELIELPALSSSEGLHSWFYCLIEPLWESPVRALLPNPDCWTEIGESKINIGMEPDIGVQLRQMTYFEQRLVETADGTKTSQLVQVSAPTARTGFEYDSEFAFLLCLDGNIPAQMRAAGKLLQSAERALFPVEIPAIRQPDYEPIILTATHPRVEKFVKLNGALCDLTAAAPLGRSNWCLALFDLRFGIQDQLNSVTTLLKQRQLKLSEAGELTTPARQRAGTKSEKQFWLKAALCCLEAQLTLTRRYPAESFGRRNLTEAILSPSHLRHQEIRGVNIASREATAAELEAETIRDAIEIGKALALGQYAYLVGASLEDLLPTTQATASPTKPRRYVEGKKAPASKSKRNKAVKAA